MTKNAGQSIATIDQFIATVGANVKTAGEKAADGGTPLSEPGSIGGETGHPVKKVDDRLQPAEEGERSAENSKDVKKDQGAPSVENAAEASTKSAASVFRVAAGLAKRADGAVSTPGSAADDHVSTTTKVAPTGEDPANETNSAKAGKEDKRQGNRGGTSHPASTENDQLDGHKYAADASLEKLAADMRQSGNALLAAIHNLSTGAQSSKTAAAAPPQQTVADPALAYHVGSELAGLITGTMDKRAADAMVTEALYGIVKTASDDADLFITYASNFHKSAEGPPAAPPEEGGGAGGEGGEPGGGMPGGGMPGGGEEAMMAALGGGEGGEGGGGGGMPGGEGGHEAEAMQLAQILQELGVTPEELQQMLAEQSGDSGGTPGGHPGMPPGGGMPPGMPPGGGMEAQAAAGRGKASADQVKRAEIRDYVTELIARTKRGR